MILTAKLDLLNINYLITICIMLLEIW
ncbi:hypothetical protein Zm00014a_033684 [Zea mays]|uniref:Uncharacterized protein n=1 Tax=Zea mays TaxID=4577 RepID=A0A3L6FRR5_MAIZE|nr:hypothetical protein Zm00014a_033684 [Zea mays]